MEQWEQWESLESHLVATTKACPRQQLVSFQALSRPAHLVARLVERQAQQHRHQQACVMASHRAAFLAKASKERLVQESLESVVFPARVFRRHASCDRQVCLVAQPAHRLVSRWAVSVMVAIVVVCLVVNLQRVVKEALLELLVDQRVASLVARQVQQQERASVKLARVASLVASLVDSLVDSLVAQVLADGAQRSEPRQVEQLAAPASEAQPHDARALMASTASKVVSHSASTALTAVSMMDSSSATHLMVVPSVASRTAALRRSAACLVRGGLQRRCQLRMRYRVKVSEP